MLEGPSRVSYTFQTASKRSEAYCWAHMDPAAKRCLNTWTSPHRRVAVSGKTGDWTSHARAVSSLACSASNEREVRSWLEILECCQPCSEAPRCNHSTGCSSRFRLRHWWAVWGKYGRDPATAVRYLGEELSDAAIGKLGKNPWSDDDARMALGIHGPQPC